MENHASRPEIAIALAGKIGSDTRMSSTVGVKFLYVAVPVPSGAIRLAVPLKEIDGQVNAIRKQLLASVALAFLPAILVAAFSPATYLQSSRASSAMPENSPAATSARV